MQPSAPVLLAAALLVQSAAAQTNCNTPSPDCVVVGKVDISVSLGAGARSNPIHGNSDIPLAVVPQISYYGKRFFLEDLELGVTVHESDANTFNLIATPGYDRVFFYSDDLQNIFVELSSNPGAGSVEFPITPKHTTYLLGPEWMFHYSRFTGLVDALYEVTGEHDGYEVRAAVAAPLIESKSSLVASAGVTWKSAETVRYYYGVEGLYQPGSALSPFLKLAYSRPLSDRWALSAFAHYEYLDASVADSPIVSDPAVVTAFVGLVFRIL